MDAPYYGHSQSLDLEEDYQQSKEDVRFEEERAYWENMGRVEGGMGDRHDHILHTHI